MKEKISFSEFIKNEILNFNWTEDQWSILFYSFLIANGVLKNDNFIVTTTLLRWEYKFNQLFNDYYKLKIQPTKTLKLLKYQINNSDFLELFNKKNEKFIIKSLDGNKAYLAGLFIGKGWVSSLSSRFYHFEVRVRNLDHSLDVQEVFDSIGIKTMTIIKNNWYYTYVKKSADISNLIKAINASQSVIYFEDVRIERDFISTFKKMESIENYNFQKTFISSQRQIEIIKNLKNSQLFQTLSKEKKDLAELRLEKNNFSLIELQMEYNKRYKTNISKSTISNWLMKIIDLLETK